MLAFPIPLIVAAILTGRWRRVTLIGIAVASLIGLTYMLDLSAPTSQTWDHRHFSAKQLVENFYSIFLVEKTEAGLEETKSWRVEWWNVILNYTFNGPYFWSGRGFGLNLAETDDFVVGDDPTAPPLRSPHSCHLTILARTGVPGFALWFLTLGTWSAMLLMNMVRARLAGDKVWADFFVLIFCYALAFMIDASFDVALEGPVSGIWFWCLLGVGIGATMIYRAPRAIDQQLGWQQGDAQFVGNA